MNKQNSIILLEMLLKGYPVIKSEQTYYLSEDNRLCMECDKYSDDVYKGKTLVAVNFGGMELSEFIFWANSFTIEEMAINAANKILNEGT